MISVEFWNLEKWFEWIFFDCSFNLWVFFKNLWMLFKSSSFLWMFFEFEVESSSVLRISSNLESNFQVFFKGYWNDFGRAFILEELMSSELGVPLFIVVSWERVHLKLIILRKSLFEISVLKTSNQFWLVKNLSARLGLIDIYLHLYFFLLEIIITYSIWLEESLILILWVQVTRDNF